MEHRVLFCSVMDAGKGSHGMRLADKLGALAKVVFMGQGIVSDNLLRVLGITQTRKDIMMAVVEADRQSHFHQQFKERFYFDRPNHGISFSIPLTAFYKANYSKEYLRYAEKGEHNMQYESIFIIVNKGYMDDVVDIAKKAGATGGTVLHGRSISERERKRLFDRLVEPEKEILIMLSQADETEKIADAVSAFFDANEKARGVLFATDVLQAEGLYEKERQ